MENSQPEARMPYQEFKELLGTKTITFYPGREGKRAFGMMDGKCVIVVKEGLTVQDLVENEERMYVVKNPKLGYFVTLNEGVEI